MLVTVSVSVSVSLCFVFVSMSAVVSACPLSTYLNIPNLISYLSCNYLSSFLLLHPLISLLFLTQLFPPLPSTEHAGTIDVEVRTWRPQGDLKSKMREYFMGSAVRLKDCSFAEVCKYGT